MPTFLPEASFTLRGKLETCAWSRAPAQTLGKGPGPPPHPCLAPEGLFIIWILTGYMGLEFGAECALSGREGSKRGPWTIWRMSAELL